MKPLLLLLCLSALLYATPQNTEWIDRAVEEIKPSRTGVAEIELQRLTNPFLYGVVEEKKPVVKKRQVKYKRTYRGKPTFHVSAILNNSAKINRRWLKQGETISGYRLSKITKEYVILKKASSRPIKVYLSHKNRKIRLQTH